MDGALASMVKSALPPARWRLVRRATNRLRWLLKLKLLRIYKFPITRHPLVAAKYVFLDPEVESYTYETSTDAEYARFLAPILNVTPEQVTAWLDEAKSDPLLTRDRGFHWSAKRRLALGNRLMWYPVVRAMKPRIMVEAGVHEGLSSEMFLTALKRNAAEGHPGRLISFDIFEDTGWLVHPDLRSNWTFICESTMTGMDPALQGLEVDVFVHETLHEEAMISRELDIIFAHAAERVTVIDSSGLVRPTLRQYAQRYGTTHHFFRDQPRNHVVVSHGTGLAIFDRDKIREVLAAAPPAPPAPREPTPAPPDVEQTPQVELS